jgi:hypothetical protein
MLKQMGKILILKQVKLMKMVKRLRKGNEDALNSKSLRL